MSKVTRRYFWCDAPSPLHGVLEAELARHASFHEEAMGLVADTGASGYAKNYFSVTGLVFAKDGPPLDAGIHWKKIGHVSEGDAYFMPKQNTKAGRALFGKIKNLRPVNVGDAISRAAGLYVMTWCGNYMYHTTAGNKDGRIFVSIPVGGDGDHFPEIPAYLIECQKWELDRWFDVGRDGVEGGGA